MADDVSNLLAIMEGIDRCADAAADSLVANCPGLNRERMKGRVAYELWLAVAEVTEHARDGRVIA